MKTLLILLTAFALQTTSLAFATGTNGQNTTTCAIDAQGVQTQLNHLLTVSSDQITDMRGQVNFIIRVGATGRLEVLDIYGDVSESVESVRRVLERCRLWVAPMVVGKSYRIGVQYGERS